MPCWHKKIINSAVFQEVPLQEMIVRGKTKSVNAFFVLFKEFNWEAQL